MPLPAHVAAQIRIRSADGDPYSFILYYRNDGVDIDAGTGPQVADALYANIDTPLKAVLPSTAQIDGVTVRAKEGASDWEFNSTDSPTAGTSTADPLPEENAVVIQRRTGLAGRSKRGRIFLPLVPETFAIDSELTPTAVTAYSAVATAAMNLVTVAGVDLHPVHIDRKNSVLVPIAEMRVYNEICSRRDRRAPKRGSVFVAPAGTGIP